MSKLRQSARGQRCTFRLVGICADPDTSTVVLCHGPYQGGMGMKSPDSFAAFGCHPCHTAMDQRKLVHTDWLEAWLLAIGRTHSIWKREDLL